MGALNEIFCFRDLVRSYLPPIGLAAARMEALAFKVAYKVIILGKNIITVNPEESCRMKIDKKKTLTPALVIEIVCCSIASWIAT